MNDQTPARRLLIIFNPAAGLRRRRRLEAVLRRLRGHACQVTVLETTGPGAAERFAAAADPERYDAVVVAGGDGTVNETINGLGDTRLPLGILPLGTANVLAAEIGLALDPDSIAAALAHGQPRPITLGTANGRRFLLMAGAGFDAHVVAAVRVPVKRWLGKGAYVLAMLQQLVRYRFGRYRVTIDGAVHEVGSVLIANAHYYGGRFVAAPAADLQSPTLQVCLFERSGRRAAIGYALALFTGRLPRLSSYRMLTAERLQIDRAQGEPVQADGDVIATLPARIEALPAALGLIYPPDHARYGPGPASVVEPRPLAGSSAGAAGLSGAGDADQCRHPGARARGELELRAPVLGQTIVAGCGRSCRATCRVPGAPGRATSGGARRSIWWSRSARALGPRGARRLTGSRASRPSWRGGSRPSSADPPWRSARRPRFRSAFGRTAIYNASLTARAAQAGSLGRARSNGGTAALPPHHSEAGEVIRLAAGMGMAARQSGAGAPLLVGVDAGTTNTKAVVADAAGSVLAVASEPTPIAYPRPEWAEYDGESLWQSSARAIRAALDQIADPGRVVGLAFASMAETAVPLDAAGQPTGPAIAWFDKRTRAEVEEIGRRIGIDRLFAISGLAPNPIFGLCKLLWHRRHRADAFAHTVKWLNVADYLAWRLCGEMATDHSLACRTYALDISTLAWSDEVLGEMALDASLMAPLVASGRRLGTVSAAAAAATGLPDHCVVAVGGHDHPVGALAADAMRPGVLLCSTGTTEAQLIGLATPAGDPALGRAGYSQGVIVVDEPVWFVVGGLSTAGAAVDWFRRTMADGADYATLIAEAAATPPGSLGAGFLPQLRLGTPPHPDTYARGAFFGLSTDTTRGCLFRAVLEGMAADTQRCALAMATLAQAPAPDAIRVIGGLTRNPVYMRIKASLAGRPLTVIELPDAVAMGAALLAGIGAGLYRDLAEAQARLRRDERVVAPDPAEHAFYRRFVDEVHAPAYPQLRAVHEAGRRLLADRDAEPGPNR